MLCEGVFLYMMLVTMFGNRLNKRRFFFIMGWGKLPNYLSYIANILNTTCIVPAIPIVAISVGLVHEHYGTDH